MMARSNISSSPLSNRSNNSSLGSPTSSSAGSDSGIEPLIHPFVGAVDGLGLKSPILTGFFQNSNNGSTTCNGYPIVPSIYHQQQTHLNSQTFPSTIFNNSFPQIVGGGSSSGSSNNSSTSSPPPSVEMLSNQFLESNHSEVSSSSSDFNHHQSKHHHYSIPPLMVPTYHHQHHQHHHQHHPFSSFIPNPSSFPDSSRRSQPAPQPYESYGYGIGGLGIMAGPSAGVMVDTTTAPSRITKPTVSSSTPKKVSVGGGGVGGGKKGKGNGKEENKRHACHLCPRAFARPSALNTHMLSHSGEKPHTCQVCHRSFSVLSNLRRHAKMHSKRTNIDPSAYQDPTVRKAVEDEEDSESFQSPPMNKIKSSPSPSISSPNLGPLTSPVEGSFFVSEALYSPQSHLHPLPPPSSLAHFTPRNPPMLMRYAQQQQHQHQNQLEQMSRQQNSPRISDQGSKSEGSKVGY